MNKHSELLDKLEHCLSDLKQTTLAGPNYNQVNLLCMEWLRLNGYSVNEPREYPDKILKYDDLISLFYMKYKEHFPEFTVPYNKTAHDRKLAKLFVESRMETDGIGRGKAMQQCASIIHAFFKHIDKFNLEVTLSFGIFGQANMGWLTNKIIDLMNMDMLKREKEKNKRLVASQTEIIKDQIGSRWSPEELDKLYRRSTK